LAVYRFCEKTGQSGFTGASGTRKEICLSHSIEFQGVRERGDDMLLSDDFPESLGAVFSIKGVRHSAGSKGKENLD